MRERAAIFGGHVEGAAQPGGGFTVRATLPLEPAP
jgi:signal transduction histidine kinase